MFAVHFSGGGEAPQLLQIAFSPEGIALLSALASVLASFMHLLAAGKNLRASYEALLPVIAALYRYLGYIAAALLALHMLGLLEISISPRLGGDSKGGQSIGQSMTRRAKLAQSDAAARRDDIAKLIAKYGGRGVR